MVGTRELELEKTFNSSLRFLGTPKMERDLSLGKKRKIKNSWEKVGHFMTHSKQPPLV
jgi:hypothetical protein